MQKKTFYIIISITILNTHPNKLTINTLHDLVSIFFFFLRDIQHMLFAYFMSMIAEKMKGRKTEWQIIGRLKI